MLDTQKIVGNWDAPAIAEESQKRHIGLPEKEADPKTDAVALSHPDAQNWFYKDPQVISCLHACLHFRPDHPIFLSHFHISITSPLPLLRSFPLRASTLPTCISGRDPRTVLFVGDDGVVSGRLFQHVVDGETRL